MNLAEILKGSTERFPGRECIIFYDRRIHYAEFYADVVKLAAAFAEMGIEPGDRVAIALPNLPEFALALYASFAVGAEVVTVNPFYTVCELDVIFKDSCVKLAIAHPMVAESMSEAAKRNTVRLLYSNNMGDPAKVDLKVLIEETKEILEPVPKQPGDTALIIYTNAYHGVPMGACLTHDGLRFDAEMSRRVAMVDEKDSLLSVIPLYHAFSLTVCLNLSLLTGGKSVFHETFSESRVVEDIKKENITLFPTVPTILKKVLDAYGDKGCDFSFVKGFIPGGAPSDIKMLQNFSSAFNAAVYQGYGITECGPVTAVNPIHKKINKWGSVGPPLEGISVRVVGESDEELPAGEVGELLVRGRNVMGKYLNRPEETDKFLRDGWFYTGDLARLDEDGFIYLTGRKKRMIIVGGFNVYPPEVERELSSHESVRACRVFGVPDDSLGEKVAAEVTLCPGAGADRIRLQKYLRQRLAPYKIPRTINFIEDV